MEGTPTAASRPDDGPDQAGVDKNGVRPSVNEKKTSKLQQCRQQIQAKLKRQEDGKTCIEVGMSRWEDFLEPAMFFHGFCFWTMQSLMEMVHTLKVCLVDYEFSPEVCENLHTHHNESSKVQQGVTKVVMYNSTISSLIPAFLMLLLGAWSDKYGRKIPLLITSACSALWIGGYMLSLLYTAWPTWLLYVFTLFDSLGGGNQAFTSLCISYLSDVTTWEERTKRIGIGMSFWYIGGPIGNIFVSLFLTYGGIHSTLQLMFFCQLSIVSYLYLVVRESHGPFCTMPKVLKHTSPDEATVLKTPWQITRDFFCVTRIKESFHTVFREREGGLRSIYICVLLSNMIRRIARSFHMYLFVQNVLQWTSVDYSWWTTYRTSFAALGSMFLMKKLLKFLNITDTGLIIMASISVFMEYMTYATLDLTDTHLLIWIGPPLGILSYSITIGLKAMATKLVSHNEKGRVSTMLSASQSLVPMFGGYAFSQLYNSTLHTMPGAQFLFSASLAGLIFSIFIAIRILKPEVDQIKPPMGNGDTPVTTVEDVPTLVAQDTEESPHAYDNPVCSSDSSDK
ncbi:probable peptidoglycan muropeptide transporter SLC46 [Palaemon carinicauda]|uniref:probable peptidoglycan muropeptide transporter SLC46 n=1 Tax=Palaemon carinicauda TaxID=392227 RepID=UPI0035B64967